MDDELPEKCDGVNEGNAHVAANRIYVKVGPFKHEDQLNKGGQDEDNVIDQKKPAIDSIGFPTGLVVWKVKLPRETSEDD